MSASFTLRSISTAAIPAALKKAEHYRLLNDAEQAQSICLDILAVDPGNEQALVVLVLAITDQFGRSGGPSVQVALDHLKKLDDPYRRHYYEGLIWERDARAALEKPMGSNFAYDGFVTAMECYEQASAVRPSEDDDEAILRWNACVRTIERAHLRARQDEVEQPLE